MQLLFVEDDVLIREVLTDCLQDHGYDVVEAATAEDAMQRMMGGFDPLLVITDIDLGAGRSGIELADWLHEGWPELGVIFVTGRLDRLRGRSPDLREASLAKPFRLSQLVELVHRFVSPSATTSRMSADGDTQAALTSGRAAPAPASCLADA